MIPIDNINDICQKILSLSESDFADAERVIEQQREYMHPLKFATVAWQRDLAEHNALVLQKLRDLKTAIESGTGIQPPDYIGGI